MPRRWDRPKNFDYEVAPDDPIALSQLISPCGRVEQHYGFPLIDLDGGAELLELRGIVNSLKPARGQKRKRRFKKAGSVGVLLKALESNDMDENKGRKAIADVGRFLIALENAVAEHYNLTSFVSQ